jgi:Ca-activated chloride channel homolog
METIRLADPWVLAFVVPAWAAILYFILGARPRRAGAGVRAALLCLAAALLAVAAARPSVRATAAGNCPVLILQDVSPSMQPRQHPADPGSALAPYVAALPAAQVGLEQFARTGATDIEAALRSAVSRFHGRPGIVVLYTDALPTEGNTLPAATGLASLGIQVHAVVPPLAPRDVRITAVDAPAEVAVGKPVRLEVRLASTVPADATVTVTRRCVAVSPFPMEQKISLGPSAPVTLVFSDTPPGPGRAEYQVAVASDADDWPENDHAARSVSVGTPAALILFVYDGPESPTLADRLRIGLAPQYDVVAIPAADFRPQDTPANLVILNNIAAPALGNDRAEALARLVADRGAGLLVLGGDASFSAGGYGQSPLDDLLPVTSRTGRRPPMEIVFIVDSSGSMNETLGEHRKITLAKQAVMALRPVLAEGDRVGVIAFAGEPRTVSPLIPVGAWDKLSTCVRDIEAGGGTRLTPAVEAAAALFGPRPEGSHAVRHIILLSDGRSDDFDVPRLVAACKAVGASVSTVATGADADLTHLSALAEATGGRAHEQQDLAQLATTFAKDMTLARGEGLLKTQARAEWIKPQPVWQSAGPILPPLDAYNPTEAKDGADVLWSVPVPGGKPAPALAVWQRGLGRAAAMPWPVSHPGTPWNAGNLLHNDLRAILDWLRATQSPTDWSARLVARDNRWYVRVEASPDRPRGPLRFALGDGDSRDLPQVAPGIFEAAVPPDAGAFLYVTQGGDQPSRQVLAVSSVAGLEFQRFGVDRTYLEEIVRAGGGRVHADPASLADAVRQVETRAHVAVGLYLVGAALGVILLLAALRLAGKI